MGPAKGADGVVVSRLLRMGEVSGLIPPVVYFGEGLN